MKIADHLRWEPRRTASGARIGVTVTDTRNGWTEEYMRDVLDVFTSISADGTLEKAVTSIYRRGRRRGAHGGRAGAQWVAEAIAAEWAELGAIAADERAEVPVGRLPTRAAVRLRLDEAITRAIAAGIPPRQLKQWFGEQLREHTRPADSRKALAG